MVPLSLVWTLLGFLIVLILRYADASYNLYLKAEEMRKLLGLNAELRYVTQGHVNNYALGFVIMVPNHISDLHFTWQSTKMAPVTYSISITVTEADILKPPQLNITRRGIIPTQEEVFRLVLQCAGNMNAEVEVLIHLNITVASSQSSTTSLVLKRKKICLKDDGINGTLMLAHDELTNSYSFYVGVGCASTILVLLTAVVITTYFRTHKNPRPEVRYGGNSPALSSTQDHVFLRAETPRNASSSESFSSDYRRITPVPSVVVTVQQVDEVKPKSLPEQIREVNVERRHIILHERLQKGTFGQTYHGTFMKDNADAATQVFIKTVTDHASQMQVSVMMAEGMMMLDLNHKNVLPLTWLCAEDPQHPMLIYPQTSQGNLKKFLLKCKFANEARCHTLSTQDLVSMAIQIVQGLMFLHKQKIIHRDIATRNCVLDDWFQVMITDNALSRDLFPNDYYCLGDNENRPVKWLALESLVKKEFSSASDVWTYGVTLWELMTLAHQPYLEVDPFEMDGYLRDGYRLAQPVNCPDELFSVMARCWAKQPDDRPSVVQLLACLQDFYATLGRFI